MEKNTSVSPPGMLCTRLGLQVACRGQNVSKRFLPAAAQSGAEYLVKRACCFCSAGPRAFCGDLRFFVHMTTSSPPRFRSTLAECPGMESVGDKNSRTKNQ